jgi:hypothetical protein
VFNANSESVAFSDPDRPATIFNDGNIIWNAAYMQPRQQSFATVYMLHQRYFGVTSG